MIIRGAILSTICWALLACNKQESLGVNEYLQWVKSPKNGLLVEKTIKPISYQVQYKPYEYIALNEMKEEYPDKTQVVGRVKQVHGMHYFNLRIIHEGGADIMQHGISSKEEFFQRSSYMSFQFQKDIKMVEGGDTLYCSLFHEVKSYGLAPHVDFVLAFDAREGQMNSTKQVIIEDNIYNNGTLKFNIQSEALQRIPSLNL